ncbi:MAG: diguanylate cyclase domain-containing protein [Acidimicrobiales bacterium]
MVAAPVEGPKRPRLVVIEDDEHLRELVRHVMEPIGWDVTTTASAALGHSAITAGDPDVVVLDLNLPDASGLAVLATLQADELTAWIPVVVVSGDHTRHAATAALLNGAQDFVTKPFEVEELQARLTAALRVATAHRALTEAREQLLHQSLHDALTGLPNRVLLFDRLRQAQAQEERHHRGLAVLFIDLDRLKEVNDDHGHDAGDELLVQVAGRLREVVREADTVARLGGDEFVVVAEAIGGSDDAGELAERLRLALAEPYVLETAEVGCTASIGVAMPRSGQELEDVLREADRAMYRAKGLGKDRWVLVDESLWVRDGSRRGPSERRW